MVPLLAMVCEIIAISKGVTFTEYWPMELIASCAESVESGNCEAVTLKGIFWLVPNSKRFVRSARSV